MTNGSGRNEALRFDALSLSSDVGKTLRRGERALRNGCIASPARMWGTMK
jgi:hypothetical protein